MTQVTYPGREASTEFGLGGFRITFKEYISLRPTKKRECGLSLGCPHPSRRNQVPMGDNATAALILSTMVTDIDVTSTQDLRSSDDKMNGRGESRGRKENRWGRRRQAIAVTLYAATASLQELGYQRCIKREIGSSGNKLTSWACG